MINHSMKLQYVLCALAMGSNIAADKLQEVTMPIILGAKLKT